MVYYVMGYRKNVVLHNLHIAFPDKTEKEKIRIAKDFYHKFIDSMIETLKLLSAPDSFFKKRFSGDWDMINRFYDKKRAVQLHAGHNFNWEWANVTLSLNSPYQILGVYMPIASKAVNKLFGKMRARAGTLMLSALNMSQEFMPFRNTPYCLGLVADQNPGSAFHKAKWFNFFGRRTAFTIGPAKNAIINNTVVVFAFIERPKRGYYHVNFELAEEFPGNTTEIDLTKRFIRYLENIIIKNPDMWLWTHRRWKHEWTEEYGFEELEIE